MTFAPMRFYTTDNEFERVFQEVRHALALHPELLDASPEQVVGFLNLKPAVFEVEAALEVLSVEGEVLS